MRVEPYGIDSVVHVVKRGARGMPITRDIADKKRFARLLYYLNDSYRCETWERDIKGLKAFERPAHWPARNKIVEILAWVLMPNHFHLLFREIKEGGISSFMQRIGVSMSMHFNEKYKETGSLFQGPYKSRTIDRDDYLLYVAPYIMAKNTFELYPGGFARATRSFDDAWKWATEKYQFSSLPDYATGASSPIIESNFLDMFGSAKQFRSLSRDMVLGKAGQRIIELSEM